MIHWIIYHPLIENDKTKYIGKDDYSFSLFPEQVVLPAFIRPKADELFSSWLVRLAYAHHVKVHTFTRICFPGVQFWNRDIDKSVPNSVLTELAKLTNSTFPQIFNSTLKSYDGILFENHNDFKCNSNWIVPLGLYHRTWRNAGLMFCPGCLRGFDEPYYKKEWRLSLSVACIECNSILLDRCPNCKSPVSFFRAELGQKSKSPNNDIDRCFSCHFPLYKSKITHADDGIICIQQMINDCINYGWSENVIYPIQYFSVLHHLLKIIVGKRSISLQLKRYLSKELKIKTIVTEGGYSNRFDVLSVNERIYGLKLATWLLDDWPARFIYVFKKQVPTHSTELLRDFIDPPFWFWEVVYKNFFQSNLNRKFMEI